MRTSRGRRNPGPASPRDGGHHGHYEKTHAGHQWWDWYAAYLRRQNGSNPGEAAAAAYRYMEEVFHVTSL